MHLIRKISGPFILVLLTATLSAQDINCNLRKSFRVREGNTLRLSNKYGDVNVIASKQDSVIVCATVTILQDDNNLAQKSMKLITFRTEKLIDTIYISTIYDRKFFLEIFRQGRKNFRVDYLIKLPAYMNLSVANEFGNVSVDELSGTLNINLSKGILSAKKLSKGNAKPISTVSVANGKVIIDEVNWMTLNLTSCPLVNIEKGQALMITSGISKILLGDISSLVSYSKSDNYSIKSINNIVSESTYTAYEIGTLNGKLISKATYGSINVADLNKGFAIIDIIAGQAQVSINTRQNSSFMADIKATDTMVDFPGLKYPGVKRTENNYSTTLLGIAGADKEPTSIIKIRTTSGKLTIQ